MEIIQHKGRKISRSETRDPDKAKMCAQETPPSSSVMIKQDALKKLQVVYYLSRNGHLDHPHFLELTHLPNQHPRLKDVMERLAVLRGKGMPSLYSWSCKRSYKNGYVWNDLAEADVIFPSEGGEYVLKGSEMLLPTTDKLQNLLLNQDSNLHPKRGLLLSKRHPEQLQHTTNNQFEQAQEVCVQKQTCNSCSRGVSTDEIDEFKHQNVPKIPQIQQTIDANSPPSSTTASTRSDISSNTLDAAIANASKFNNNADGDAEPMLSRNSMLLSLIACGGSSSFRRGLALAPARKSCSEGTLHKGVVVRNKAAAEEEEEMIMINYMSENPRLIGNVPASEKEYFSGSIVEAMTGEERLGGDQRPGLKRSSSFNQERSNTTGSNEVVVTITRSEEEMKRKKETMTGKCIPRKRLPSSSSKHIKK